MSDYDRKVFKQVAENVLKKHSNTFERLAKHDTQGTKHDSEKPLLALVPMRALEEEAKVWTFGASKYDAHNWRKGLTYSRILSAMGRHWMAMVSGEDIDPESGLSHAAHVRCCAAMLIEFQKDGRMDLDDRFKTSNNAGKTQE